MEITDLMLLSRFRQCSHILFHRNSQFHGKGRILILLKEKGSMTQRELSQFIQRRSATLSEQLDKMEKEHWIIREKCEMDKRNVKITLTDLGRQMAEEAKREREELAWKQFHQLEKEDREHFYRILSRLKEDWEQEEESLQEGEAQV